MASIARPVVSKHGGTDETGANVTFTEELSQTDEYGILDWTCLGMAFREFVSNAIDAAISVNTGNTKVDGQTLAKPWDGVKVELVSEAKVRAKRGHTRVFVPADHEEVIRFFAHLGKWFLHFSEPESITQTILAKKARNLDPQCRTAVIYRRGVRVTSEQVTATINSLYPNGITVVDGGVMLRTIVLHLKRQISSGNVCR